MTLKKNPRGYDIHKLVALHSRHQHCLVEQKCSSVEVQPSASLEDLATDGYKGTNEPPVDTFRIPVEPLFLVAGTSVRVTTKSATCQSQARWRNARHYEKPDTNQDVRPVDTSAIANLPALILISTSRASTRNCRRVERRAYQPTDKANAPL